MITEIVCESVSEGLISDEKSVSVKTVHGKLERFRVPAGAITSTEHGNVVEVGVVYHDEKAGRYLVEFPSEADSGANRAWVAGSLIRTPLAEFVA